MMSGKSRIASITSKPDAEGQGSSFTTILNLDKPFLPLGMTHLRPPKRVEPDVESMPIATWSHFGIFNFEQRGSARRRGFWVGKKVRCGSRFPG